VARNLKEWKRKVKEAYKKFAESPSCERCPLGFDTSSEFRPFQNLVNNKHNMSSCAACYHILGTPQISIYGPWWCPCPCYIYGPEEAFKILLEKVQQF
jgi:hypothetical protein